jgi:hypothetical protein
VSRKSAEAAKVKADAAVEAAEAARVKAGAAVVQVETETTAATEKVREAARVATEKVAMASKATAEAADQVQKELMVQKGLMDATTDAKAAAVAAGKAHAAAVAALQEVQAAKVRDEWADEMRRRVCAQMHLLRTDEDDL